MKHYREEIVEEEQLKQQWCPSEYPYIYYADPLNRKDSAVGPQCNRKSKRQLYSQCGHKYQY